MYIFSLAGVWSLALLLYSSQGCFISSEALILFLTSIIFHVSRSKQKQTDDVTPIVLWLQPLSGFKMCQNLKCNDSKYVSICDVRGTPHWPIRSQYSVHMISIDQSEASDQHVGGTSYQATGRWLVTAGNCIWILASDWSILVRWHWNTFHPRSSVVVRTWAW